MSNSFDVIIVGSGPAGVSAAFPLVQAGIKVLMVDGGNEPTLALPSHPYLTERFEHQEQWEWMLGKDFYALQKKTAVSPKLRVPTHSYVFKNFLKKNHINAEDFIAVGSLAKGGLSNAWGCGVARLSSKELADYPFHESDIKKSYEAVTRRIGVSGAYDDDLSDYFGLDEWSQPPIQVDNLHQHMFTRYLSHQQGLYNPRFRLGHSRVAVLSQNLGVRKACNLSANCLWGCHRDSLYSSTNDLSSLSEYKNFYYKSGFIVDRISQSSDHLSVEGQDIRGLSSFTAQRIILAAGTLATTRLALSSLKLDTTVRVQSCPTAAFLLWLPGMLGAKKTDSFGLGQLSYSLKLSDEITAFGSTFSTVGIPVSEFVRHLPLSRRFGIDLLKQLLGSCLVGNIFLPGYLSSTDASLGFDGALNIKGGYSSSVDNLMSEAVIKLRKSYWKLGAFLLPKSFTRALPGGDIHYSSTLPMRSSPGSGETDMYGELFGLDGVHIVDGASLPTLTEKSHTLTIMANADRIGRVLVNKIKGCH